MNAVFIRHFDNRQYLFEVPESIKLKEGDRVMVRNRRGEVDGICTCDSLVGRVCVKKFEGIDDV